MLEFNNRKHEEKYHLEEEKKAKVRQLTEANIQASASDKQRSLEAQKEAKRLEQERFRENILKMQEQERQRGIQEKMQRQTVQM